jgi:uncharacterized protein (TIGR00375 family)
MVQLFRFMHFVCDFHLHSKYSRAVSQNMILPEMARVAQDKGLDILTTSDWTHPLWFKEVTTLLTEAGDGIYKLKNQPTPEAGKDTLFILSTEISCIYSQGGKLRRIHNLVFAPDIATAEKINKELTKRGYNLHSDGRPIIGLSSKHLLELLLSIDHRVMLIPCHVWTPHFGLYGSASGFNSITEAFEELSDNIYGIETGLSSDPEMNWQIGELTNRTILSFSDAHSAAKMGREATVFSLDTPNYPSIQEAIKHKSLKRKTNNTIVYTIEFYPEEGKYHFSGHRGCKVVFGPEEIKSQGNTCPVCHRKLTEGVLFRLQQLAGQQAPSIVDHKQNQQGLQWYTDKTKNHPPYVKLVQLLEILAESMGSTVFSQKVKTAYATLIGKLGNELTILLKTSPDDIAAIAGPRVAEGIVKVRTGRIVIAPGYDGEYGKVSIWGATDDSPTNSDDPAPQLSLEL